ncbi:unnamed protein product [Rangifer tarandus platyrhynchus]|uniref:Uncharacterized protein n=1 Tax=Rangifer tarandus platyrhynchus TaxID=3082113 RepID=A0ABN9A4H3_RANTA|nr:unnamed protein product [Rangifer tarandus platyrhynchus]
MLEQQAGPALGRAARSATLSPRGTGPQVPSLLLLGKLAPHAFVRVRRSQAHPFGGSRPAPTEVPLLLSRRSPFLVIFFFFRDAEGLWGRAAALAPLDFAARAPQDEAAPPVQEARSPPPPAAAPPKARRWEPAGPGEPLGRGVGPVGRREAGCLRVPPEKRSPAGAWHLKVRFG